MRYPRLFPSALLIVVAGSFCGCAGLFTRVDPPFVSLANLSVEDVKLFEQTFGLQLRIQNPNAFDLPISGIVCSLDLNGREFARGVSQQSVTVPAYGDRLLDVQVVSTLGQAFSQIKALQSKPQGLQYRLHGSLSVTNRAARIPFEYQGGIGIEQ
jgi:LEA14-like dessication related protein